MDILSFAKELNLLHIEADLFWYSNHTLLQPFVSNIG